MVQDIKRTNRWPKLDSRLRPHTAHILGSYSEHPDLCHLYIPLHIPLVHHKRQRFERCNFCWRSVERHWSGSCKGRRRSQTEQSKLATDTHSPSHSHCHNTKGNCPNAHSSRSLPRSRLSSPPIIAGALFCSSTNDFFSHVLLNVGLCTMALKSLLDKGGGGEGSLSGGGGGGGGGASIVWSAWFTSTPWSSWVIVTTRSVEGTRMGEWICDARREGSIGSVSRGPSSVTLVRRCAEEP